MSVVGVGTDIVDISRIEKMKAHAMEKLALRVLTPAEYTRYESLNFRHRYLAKRWAAKEAASKALGTGIAAGVSFQHIEITSKESGQPILHFSEAALEKAQALGASNWHLSIADEQHLATAFVVLSR